MTVIPNSSDLELFAHSASGAQRFRQSHPELGDGPIVLYPGTLGKANGVTYLPALAARVCALRDDLRFVVIGAGAEAPQVQAEAQRLGVAEVNFFQYPAMPKAQLVDAFSASAVLISLFIDNPVLWANSANKFFDGLAAGKAIAINYRGWQAALLQETGAGVVLPPQANDEAAQKLLGLLTDAPRLRTVGQRARHLAETRFSRDLLADRLERVLLDVAT